MTENENESNIGVDVATMKPTSILEREDLAMPLSQDDKDEIRELIATEMVRAVQGAVRAVLNAPIQLHEVHTAMSPEGRQAREERNNIVREIGDAIVKSFEAVEREAQARVVEKTDPARADIIRKLVPTF
ncbi:MAG: hypothetical protein H7Y30_04020 [Pyrinomonadaceae bacterium]|nr:hypothetical protein [Pyrinomonadaceae bacterium]